jgi:hypothetical protein
VGGETNQIGGAVVRARVWRAKEKVVHKAKEKVVQRAKKRAVHKAKKKAVHRAKERAVQQALKTLSSIGRNGHQSSCRRLYKKLACDK